MWHQVVDMPESYAEFSCTCMIGFALQRGIERGWLEKEKYEGAVAQAWAAIVDRIEVVKGPNPILAPQPTSPGGTVNSATKKPQFRDFGMINVQVG